MSNTNADRADIQKVRRLGRAVRQGMNRLEEVREDLEKIADLCETDAARAPRQHEVPEIEDREGGIEWQRPAQIALHDAPRGLMRLAGRLRRLANRLDAAAMQPFRPDPPPILPSSQRDV